MMTVTNGVADDGTGAMSGTRGSIPKFPEDVIINRFYYLSDAPSAV